MRTTIWTVSMALFATNIIPPIEEYPLFFVFFMNLGLCFSLVQDCKEIFNPHQ